MDKKQPQQISVELPAETALGEYCNLSLITHSPNEFVIDFAKLLPGLPKAKVCQRIILTPQNAKGLLKTLEANVQRFEDHHGEIKLPGQPSQIAFQTPETKN